MRSTRSLRTEGPSFRDRVLAAVETIPRGKVATYGQIALLAGNPRAARAVGNVLHANPRPFVTPCHRVVNAYGRLSPAYAFGGSGVQRALLKAEGVAVRDDDTVDLVRYGIRKEDMG